MRWPALGIVIVLVILNGAAGLHGIEITVKLPQGVEREVHFYDGSYALLLGASRYTAGWPTLESVTKEMDRLESALEANGFAVTRVDNPSSDTLERSFEEFIDQYGYNPGNRLLVFFSGHGHTRQEGEKGYLVPVDAPDPAMNERDFIRKALPMSQVLAWARDMEAKHVLFMFDSCFSGTVFKQKALSKPPIYISEIANKPVRQFITAGSAGEMVPAESTFTPAFIDAIIYGLGDLNDDGYISGMELGLFLQQEVPLHVQQTPQYGKIPDYKLSRGDFIFLAGARPGSTEDRSETQIQERQPQSSLKISSTPSRADVVIDGKPVGLTPLDHYDVQPGEARVSVSKDGYQTVDQTVVFTPGVRKVLVIQLEELEKKGWLTVATKPAEARVRILNIAPKYYSGIELQAGSYHVEVSAGGYETKRQWIELQAGNELHVSITLEPKLEETVAVVEKQSKKPQTTGSTHPSRVAVIKDERSGRTWTAVDNGENITWQQADRYCRSLVRAGSSRWRLPHEDELHSFFKSTKAAQLRTAGFTYWSATEKLQTALRYDPRKKKSYRSLKKNSVSIRALCVY